MKETDSLHTKEIVDADKINTPKVMTITTGYALKATPSMMDRFAHLSKP
jgi:hypothetical protein